MLFNFASLIERVVNYSVKLSKKKGNLNLKLIVKANKTDAEISLPISIRAQQAKHNIFGER